MPSTIESPPIACVSAPLSAVETDILMVPWFEGEAPTAVQGLDAASGGEIGRALGSKEFCGKTFELFVTPVTDRSWRSRRVMLVGGGSAADYGSALARQIAAAGGISARNRRAEQGAFVLRGRAGGAELAQAAAEGLT